MGFLKLRYQVFETNCVCVTLSLTFSLFCQLLYRENLWRRGYGQFSAV